jgi:hypothetical protein
LQNNIFVSATNKHQGQLGLYKIDKNSFGKTLFVLSRREIMPELTYSASHTNNTAHPLSDGACFCCQSRGEKRCDSSGLYLSCNVKVTIISNT